MNYEGIGKIELFGCAVFELDYYADNLYSIRDLLYIKPKALLGILEKIVIKNILINGEYPYFITYIDTFNSLWNENELIYLENAQDLIINFEIRKNHQFLKDAKNC